MSGILVVNGFSFDIAYSNKKPKKDEIVQKIQIWKKPTKKQPSIKVKEKKLKNREMWFVLGELTNGHWLDSVADKWHELIDVDTQ